MEARARPRLADLLPGTTEAIRRPREEPERDSRSSYLLGLESPLPSSVDSPLFVNSTGKRALALLVPS